MNARETVAVTVLLIACLSVIACAPTPPIDVISVNPANPIRMVAVLPLINNSNDVDGPLYVREKLIKELERYHYAIKPLNDVDQILKDQAGITLGSQLDLTTPEKLGEILGVDGVFYASLDNFDRKIAVEYNVRRVRIRLKLADGKTGKTVWKGGVGVKQEILGKLGLVSALAVRARDDQDAGEGLQPLLGEAVRAPWFRLPVIELPFAPFTNAARLASEDRHPLRDETRWAVQVVLKGAYPDIDVQCSGGPQSSCYEVLNAHRMISSGTPLPPGPDN